MVHMACSPRRCRSARTACRPRSRLPCTGAPRGRAGTRWCGKTAASASLGAARGETLTFVPGPRAGARAGRGAGRGARDAVEKGGSVWLGNAGTRLPRGRPRPPRRVVSLPTPHSPARVRVGARAAASSRSSVRGAIAPISDLGRLSSPGCVDFITRDCGDADWFSGISSSNGGENRTVVISVRAEGPDTGQELEK
uniref:Uncharacterized protein n=1 Tax=Peromyscus maniculatus bairdii TaxID=230844 RepID=A0A8C8UPN9_PERMB